MGHFYLSSFTALELINLTVIKDGKEINFTSMVAEAKMDYSLSFALKNGGRFPDSYDSNALLERYKNSLFEICFYEEAKRNGGILGVPPGDYPYNNMTPAAYMEKMAHICETIEEIQNRNAVILKPAKV
jgi:hypothetical protein